jgi:hypothetical protein
MLSISPKWNNYVWLCKLNVVLSPLIQLGARKKRVSSNTNKCKNGQEFEKYNPHVDLVSGWQVTAILMKNIQIKYCLFLIVP